MRDRQYGEALRGLIIAFVVGAAIAAAAVVFVDHGTRSWSREERAIVRESLVPSYSGAYWGGGPYPGPRVWASSPAVRIVGGLPAERPPLGGRDQANPALIAQYGLWAYSRFLAAQTRSSRATVLHAANWLVRKQRRNGSWIYLFEDPYPGGELGNLEPPWSSALAQGQAMSLLERAYRITGRRAYLASAIRGLRPLERPVRDGGLRRCFGGNCRLPFFEEAPSAEPSLILNGFMFALVGLYDLSTVAPSSEAGSLYRAGRLTLHVALPRYDHHGLATYDLLTHRIANAKYQAIHIYLLQALDSLSRDHRFTFYARRWRRHLGQAPA